MNYQNQLLPNHIAETLAQIRELYSNYFDRSWFNVFLEDFPMTSGQFHDIRYCLSITMPMSSDIPVLRQGISSLKIYIQLLYENVLPKISEIALENRSNWKFDSMSRDVKTQRKIIAYLLPPNIKTLETLVEELQSKMPLEKVIRRRRKR